jgi:hypothetical protein
MLQRSAEFGHAYHTLSRSEKFKWCHRGRDIIESETKPVKTSCQTRVSLGPPNALNPHCLDSFIQSTFEIWSNNPEAKELVVFNPRHRIKERRSIASVDGWCPKRNGKKCVCAKIRVIEENVSVNWIVSSTLARRMKQVGDEVWNKLMNGNGKQRNMRESLPFH